MTLRIRLLCRTVERKPRQLDRLIQNLFPQAIYGVHSITGTGDVITIYIREKITKEELERRKLLLAINFELIGTPMIIGNQNDYHKN